jgi:predicted HicB family RNase H-like nuclease
VNFRISPRQHERLAEAAQRIGAKPGQLARILTMRGVEHMLWEERSRG